ncbi:aminotransferase class I/II-fold pyridoxal phosphate-dependent enzyme [Candidatus Gracilibacteria bacterium]|nr:aminotransferase class I/II-fold pyridoxal phosphate-dependent enzyme [Candidatus Gracilibacteria bacterium]
MHTTLIDTLSEKYLKNSWSKKELLMELFSNQELKDSIPNEIRRSTIIGNIANQILVNIGQDDLCKILAIGDIRYFDELHQKWKDLVKESLSQTDISKLEGYDLSGLGSAELRMQIRNYMSHYYDFSLLSTSVEDAIVPSYGGTDSFVTILNTLKNISKNTKINFIYPEASFLANTKITEMILGDDSIISLKKPEKRDFFISLEQVQDLYRETIRISDTNIFYITPVGNPTGNKIDSKNLSQILEGIHHLDPHAVFILDTVYVGLLINTESQLLFERIFRNTSLMERIVFTESISKTLGTTGIRLGWTWTLNSRISNEIKKYTSLTKAGFSKILDEFALGLLGNSEIFDFQNEVYEFWSCQRMGFLRYLKANFSDLFDFDSSPEITDREGIYILLKIRGDNSKEAIFAQTGIIGVGIALSDGNYIRYAFGNVNYF